MGAGIAKLGRPCSICGHPERADIDAALAVGIPKSSIASAYGVYPDSLRRHEQNHGPEDELLLAVVDMRSQLDHLAGLLVGR